MVRIDTFEVNGEQIQGLTIGEKNPNMIMFLLRRGYIMCGYLNLQTAEEDGDTAAVISAPDLATLLDNKVKGMTSKAAALGVEIGMTGREAVRILNQK